MREVHIYIENQRLELFEDEVIQINSSVQNVQDIAKVFTDFSQSFTVPASERNNAIFQHFYESAIDSSLDYQIRRTARIEIDLIPFRTGKIQLEKANLQKGRVQSYSVTFYGDIRTLQDYFGEDKLNTLDMSAYSHAYNGSEVQTRITSNSSYDVRYPLISSSRVWVYGGGGQQDISQNSHHMHYYELFPAIRVARIFDAIETKYGISFDGLFLNDKRFTNLYLWLKNKDNLDNLSNTKDVDLTTKGATTVDGTQPLINVIDLDTNEVVFNQDTVPFASSSGLLSRTIKLEAQIYSNPNGSSNKIYLDVYENGSLITTVENPTGTSPLANFTKIDIVNNGLNKKYSFKVRSAQNTTINGNIFITYYINGVQTLWGSAFATMATMNFTMDMNLSNNMPDMKISEFVSGILKQFNLTCTPTNNTTFKIEPLEDWYAEGRLIDVTKHIDVNNIDIEKTKIYKKIDFKRQKSETVLNRNFGDSNFREFGDLQQVFEYDGTEYTVELPFENILHQKFTNTSLQVGYSLDKNFQPIIPKATLLYMNDLKTCSFYFNNGTSTNHITQYMPFGQDLEYNGDRYTLNFGWDNSSYYLEPIQNNIYMTYYNNYLSNLYSRKQRITYCKGLFPTPILTSLKMNDRLIIRDKRYIINDIKTNLNTGDVDLTLLYDFRELTNFIEVPTGASQIKEPIYLGNDVTQINFDTGTTGITVTPSTINQDTIVDITLPVLTPSYTLIAENEDDLITEDTFEFLRSEENNPVSYTITIEKIYVNNPVQYSEWILTQTP